MGEGALGVSLVKRLEPANRNSIRYCALRVFLPVFLSCFMIDASQLKTQSSGFDTCIFKSTPGCTWILRYGYGMSHKLLQVQDVDLHIRAFPIDRSVHQPTYPSLETPCVGSGGSSISPSPFQKKLDTMGFSYARNIC